MDIQIPEEGRYDRQERISWWDQARLTESRVLLVGAGALGNEVAKNLALVGVGHVSVVDMDRIEPSNLSRCVFFTQGDVGRFKADVVAAGMRQLNPEVAATSLCDSVQRLGLDSFREFDLVVGALDSREARLWVGQACRKFGMTWIDGAIEGLSGLARTFGPEGACYECTLGERDREILSSRRACSLLSSAEIEAGRTPTTASTSSIVAGIQSQEAVRFLSTGLAPALQGKVWYYMGETLTSYVVEYVEDPDCMSHDHYLDWADAVWAGEQSTIRDVAALAAVTDVMSPTAVDLEDELVTIEACRDCGQGDRFTAFRSSLASGAAECGNCGGALVALPELSLSWESQLLDLPLSTFNPAKRDVLTFRSGSARLHVPYEIGSGM